jgi:hypothetical protein
MVEKQVEPLIDALHESTELADELEHEMSIVEQRHVAALAWAGADLYIASLQALLGHYRATKDQLLCQ